MEQWKDVIWYEWLYQVSDLGNIKSLNYNHTWKERLLSKCKWSRWYIIIGLFKNKIKTYHLLHRLVAKSFISNPENKPQINHINWIKYDNKLINLEWSNASENWLHSYKLWLSNNDNRKKSILQISKEWIIINKFSSIHEAWKNTNTSTWNITSVCKENRRYAWGFIWKYFKQN